MGNPLYPDTYEEQCKKALKYIPPDALHWIGHHLNNSLQAVYGYFEGTCKKKEAAEALKHAINDVKTILNQKR